MVKQQSNSSIKLATGAALALTLLMAMLFAAASPMTPEVAEAAPAMQATTFVRFSSLVYAEFENSGTATISVQLSATAPTTVTVNYATANGTATAGADYVSASGTLTFTVGQSSQSFNVTILDDSVDEPDETVNLILQSATNATLDSTRSLAALTIQDNDPAPTSTATATSGAPSIFIDGYEPNNTFADAYSTSAGAGKLCDNTLWPIGDEDFFKFWGRAGSTYEILTSDLDPGIDTFLTIYGPGGNMITSNDNRQTGSRDSRSIITAAGEGFYFARVVNKDPSDPANKTYCVAVNEISPPTPTATATLETPAGDECEFNSTFDTACLIGPGETKSLDFVPSFGSQQDTDIFKLWMKPGIEYSCETLNLSSVNDTNIILYDGNRNAFNPPIGNDDKAPGDLGSKVKYLSTYTGWLYIMVGPVNPPPVKDAALYTYDLECTAVAATATPTATPTFKPLPPGTGTSAGTSTPTPTPIVFPTFPPTPTPIDLSQLATMVPAAPPTVVFRPLPTATPAADAQRPASVSLTLYYDTNRDFTPQESEGIVDVAVALYDNSTGQLLQFGHTNESGQLTFGSISASGAVRVEVPYLNYRQIVAGAAANILLRVAPQTLPGNIP